MKKIYFLLVVLALVLTTAYAQLKGFGDIEVKEKIEELKTEVQEMVEVSEDENEISILAFGDVMLGRYVRTLMDRNGKEYIFEKLGRLENLADGPEDFIFANLEGPIEGEGYKSQTQMVFGFHEDTGEFLKNSGFNILSIANNHAVDQGWDGRESTIKILEENGLGWCGHPSEADPESVYYTEVRGQKVAFVCFNDVQFRLDDAKALELIKSVREKTDYLIVSIHWGVEYAKKAHQKLQVARAHQFIDAGADIIIGHHPHVVQNYEEYKGKFIFYSLGNFVFDQYWSAETQKELALKIILKKENGKLKSSVTLIPLKSVKSQTQIDENSKEYDIMAES